MAKRAAGSQEADVISTLPDEVLTHIISFLPLKQAIRTSFLSSRWSKIFTSISNLDFHDGFTNTRSESCSFMNFVDRVLFYHTGIVDKVSVTCGGFVDSYRVNQWIEYALHNKVRELDLDLSCQIYNKLLPTGLFTCKTLEVLSLCIIFKFVLKLPATICLPSLKCLHLCSIELLSDDDSIKRLFSSCSVLEELVIQGCSLRKRCKFNVFNPTLKRLTIEYIKDFGEDYEIGIDAPSLVYFKCLYLPTIFLLKNLNSLVEVHIDFGPKYQSYHSFPSYNSTTIDLFKGINNGQSLHLSGTLPEVFLQGNRLIPELPKLTYLNLDADFYVGWGRVLPNLLSCFPSLQALDFTVNPWIWGHIKSVNLPSNRFPSCLWSQLKTLQILSFEGKDRELQMVEYFLKNAQVLDSFTLQTVRTRRHMAEKWRSKITNKVLKLPKISKNCKILVV